MNSFLIAVDAVLPFLIYISFGYGVRRAGVADEAFMYRLNSLIFRAFFPIMMFYNLYSVEHGLSLDPKMVGLSAASILLLELLLVLIVPRLVAENPKRGVIIQAMYRSNFVLFGIPLATSIFGSGGTTLATMMIAIVIPIYNVTAVIILEMYRGGKISPGVLAKNVIHNPMIRGAVVGFVFFILNIKLPASVEEPIAQLAALSTPMALFVLGGTLHFSAIRHNLRYLVPAISIKLLVLPAIALAAATALGLGSVERFVYFEMFATPVATASYSMAQNMGGDGELAGQLVFISTSVSVFTIFLWVFFLSGTGLI